MEEEDWYSQDKKYLKTLEHMDNRACIDNASRMIDIYEKQIRYLRKKLFMLVSERDIELIEKDLSEIRKRGSM